MRRLAGFVRGAGRYDAAAAMMRACRPLLLLLLAATWAQAETAAPAKSFLWEVKSATNTLYIVGAPGVGRRDFYPMNQWIEAAYLRAKVLVVESDLTDTDRFRRESADIYYPSGDSLERHVSKQTYDDIYDFHALKGMPIEPALHVKPYVLAVSLLNHEAELAGYSPELDVPFYFIPRAKADEKPIEELQGVRQEVSDLESLPMALQEAMVHGAMAKVLRGDWGSRLQAEIDAWSTGDTARYEKLDLTSYDDGPAGGAQLRAKLVSDGNAAVAERLQAYLKGDTVHLVVVSAARLVGPANLPQLLRARGYRVQQL